MRTFDIFAPLVCVAALVLAGCASEGKRPEGCDKEYAGTVMACGTPRRPEDHRNDVEVCNVRGSVRECEWVPRDQVRRIIQDMIS